MAYLLIVVGALALDQWSKWLVLLYLPLFQPTPLLARWLNFTVWHNSGGAFSLFQGQGRWLAAVAVFVSGGIAVLLLRFPRTNRALNVGLALIAGGALGNLIDRIRWGYVIDFIQVCFNDVCVFPIFNVADSAIVVGTALILWTWIKQPQPHQDLSTLKRP